MNTEYATGEWYLAASADTVVLLDPGISPEVAAQIWRVIDAGGELAEVLEALTAAVGPSLTDIPPFCVATAHGNDLHVAVRGPLVLRAGDTETTGTGAVTWREEDLVDPSRVEIGDVPATHISPLPLRSGVVMAGLVRIALREPRLDDDEPPELAEPAEASGPQEQRRPAQDDAKEAASPGTAPVADRIKPTPAASGVATESSKGTWSESRLADDDPFAETVMSARRRRGSLGAANDDSVSDEMVGAPPAVGGGPARGELVLSTGQRAQIDRPVVVGRRPRQTRHDDVAVHLIEVPSPSQDVSRSHLEFRPSGSQVVAIDLDSTNGTVLYREGQDPRRMQPRDEVLVVDGDAFDLGDGVTVEFVEAT